MFFCCCAQGREIYIDKHNFSLINNNLSGHYHLLESINFAGQNIPSLGSASQPFNGTLDGRGFTLSNYSQVSEQLAAGLFFGLGDNVKITGVGFSDIFITGESAFSLASFIGDNCTIHIDFMRNFRISASKEASLLTGTVGDNNDIRVGYIDQHIVNAKAGNVTTLALRSGDHNYFSVGYAAIRLFGAGVNSGVVAAAGSNNTIHNSVLLFDQLPFSASVRSITASPEVNCTNNLWKNDRFTRDSGCEAPGFSDQSLRQLTRTSRELVDFDVSQFRFGNSSQYPLAKEFGDILASRNDEFCKRLACQLSPCDTSQGTVITQIFDDNYEYRYILSHEHSAGNLAFRIIRLHSDGTRDTAFGDQGIARYFGGQSQAAGFHTQGAAMIHNALLWVAGQNSAGQIQIFKFPLTGVAAENIYSVDSTGIWGQDPLLIFAYFGIVFNISGPFITLVTDVLNANLLHDYRIYANVEGRLRSYIHYPVESITNLAEEVQALAVNTRSPEFIYYVLSQDEQWQLYKADIFAETTELIYSDTIIDPTEPPAVFIRNVGIWLVQTSSFGDYQVDLVDSDDGNSNYTYRGAGLPSHFLLLPDDAPRPLLHLVYHNASSGCLVMNHFVESEAETLYCLSPFFCRLRGFFNQLRLYLKSLAIMYRILNISY